MTTVNKVTVPIDVTDRGTTQRVTKEVKVLRKELQGAQKDAVLRPAGQTTSVSKAKAIASRPVGSTDTPGLERGATGVGGGSGAKDFSRQAQGLGGLVHVYATFAANIFAVTAAFTALSKAADYTNMVEGLNQLGAASGKNLGSMAKNMAKITDGAVSLKSAMEATAQASSAGMSGAQISRMAKLAKNASQALGRDTEDSLNRLSRGISKVEPELLDELGIMVRVDKAAADYARTIGKTASALTDFERRQSFANAVLKQGEDKFGSLKIDANQYSKLQASFTNLLFTGGELINKVLEPIVKVLGASPTALAGVMVAITTMLLSKAIPALKGWKDNIKAAAEETRKLSDSKVEKAQEVRVSNLLKVKEQAELRANVEAEAYNSAAERLERSGKKKGLTKRAQSIINAPAVMASKEDLAYLDKLASATNKATGQATKLAAAYREAALAIRESKKAEAAYSSARDRHAEELLKTPGVLTAERQNQIIANRLQRRSLSQGAVSGAVQEASSLGWSAGWAKLKEGISEAEKTAQKSGHTFGKLAKGMTYLKGTIALAAGAVGTFVSAFSWVGVVIATVIGAFELLYSFSSKNSRELEEFSTSSTTLKESLEGLSRTMDYIGKKDVLTKLSSTSLQAKATAINEVSTSVSKLIDDLERADKQANEFDKTWDYIKRIFGGGLKTTSAKGVASAIGDVLNNSLDSVDKTELQGKLKSILELDNLSQDSIQKKLDSLDERKYVSTLREIDKAQQKFNTNVNNNASRLTAFNTATTDLEKQMQSLVAGFTPTDSMAKFGMAQMVQASELTEALKDSESALVALSETAADFGKLKLLPPSLASQLASYNTELTQLNNTIGVLDQAVVESNKNISALEITKNSATGTWEDVLKLQQERERNRAIKLSREQEYKKVEKIAIIFDSAAEQIYREGAKHLQESLKIGGEQAALSISKSLVSGLSGPGAAEANKIVQLQEIAIQEKILTSQAALIISQEELALAIEEQTIEDRIFRTGKVTDKDKNRLQDIGKIQLALANPIDKIAGALDALENTSRKGLLPTRTALSGLANQQTQLNAGKTNAINTAELAKFAEIAQKKEQLYRLSITSNKAAEEYLNLLTQSKDIYVESLEYDKEKVIASREYIELYQKEAQLEAAVSQSKYRDSKLSNDQLRKAAKESSDFNIINLLDDIENKRQQNYISEKKRVETLFSLQQAHKNALRELDNRQKVANENVIKESISLAKTVLDKQRSTGNISESMSISETAKLDTIAQNMELTASIRTLTDAHNDKISVSNKDIDALKKLQNAEIEGTVKYFQAAEGIASVEKRLTELNRAHEVEKNSLNTINQLKIAQIKINEEYQKSLVKTEETLRSLEKLGLTGEGNVSKYFGALADDFNNKLGQMIQAAKSAGDTFNQGLISAIDSTIDKFYDAMQKSELTFEDMVKSARNALSDVFRDTASQLMKNAWKDALKPILGESTQEKAAREAQEATNRNTIAIERNTAALTGDVSNKVPTDSLEKVTDKSEKTANIELTTAQAWEKTTSEFTTDFGLVLQGQKSATDMFGNLVGNLGGVFGSFVKGLFSVLSSIGGSSSGGGIFETLFKVGASMLTGSFGGAGSMIGPATGSVVANTASAMSIPVTDYGAGIITLPHAKGGTFSGSPSLSAYSNSVVSSPTMFAFAKGAGVMGEAGPEAIMPLKRDSSGNLGVRGGGGNTNNVEIVINIEQGQVKDTSTSTLDSSSMASQLGNIIKATVTQELIKQSRPGGLLAR